MVLGPQARGVPGGVDPPGADAVDTRRARERRRLRVGEPDEARLGGAIALSGVGHQYALAKFIHACLQ
jgi:hypothetical protein